VTAHCDPQTRQRAALAEPVGFIEKPFTPDALKRAIDAAMNPCTGDD
jgi:CheY-like chemotaxis protein